MIIIIIIIHCHCMQVLIHVYFLQACWILLLLGWIFVPIYIRSRVSTDSTHYLLHVHCTDCSTSFYTPTTKSISLWQTPVMLQGAKKIIFTACHSGKLKLAVTSPDVISTSPKNFLTGRNVFIVLLLFEFLKNITCLSGKLKTEFTSPIAKQLQLIH